MRFDFQPPSSPLRQAGTAALIALAITLPGVASAQSLRLSIEAALKTNPTVLSAAAQRRAAAADQEQARAGYLPSVDASAANGREHSDTPQTRAAGIGSANLMRREAGVVVSQRLFDGFSTKTEVERQAARLEVATSRLSEVREAIALRTAEVYVEVLKHRELVKLAQENIQAHQRSVDKVQLRVKGGVSQRADLQQASSRLALARSVLAARAGKLREVEANYLRVVGEVPGTLADPDAKSAAVLSNGVVDDQALSQAIRQAAEAAAASNPAIQAANAEISASDAAVRNARSSYWPRVNLELSANRNQNISGIQGDVNTEALMFTMRWNLFRGGADKAQEKANTERRYAAIDSAASTRREVEERVAVALHNKAASEERLAYLRQHVALSAEVLDSYQQQLDLGRRSLLDVLNAESELFSARSNFSVGRYEDLLNQFSVEGAKGLLIRSLGIAIAD